MTRLPLRTVDDAPDAAKAGLDNVLPGDLSSQTVVEISDGSIIHASTVEVATDADAR